MKFGDTIQFVVKSGITYNTVREFKIVGIVDDLEPYIPTNSRMNVILSKSLMAEEDETLGKLFMDNLKTFELYIDTDNPTALEAEVAELNGLRNSQGKGKLYGVNEFDSTDQLMLQEVRQRQLVKIPIYIFVGMITLFSVLNIFSTISNSIILRKREIAELKSLGMSNKAVNKMLFLEGIFYGFDGLCIGIFISMIIQYLMYLIMVDTMLFIFKIPWVSILECIIVTYFVISIAIHNAKKKIAKNNIIDDIKNENI